MSFFEKPKIDLKKHYIIHFFSVRLRHFRGLTFMVCIHANLLQQLTA